MLRFWSFLRSLWPLSWRLSRRSVAVDEAELPRTDAPLDSQRASIAPAPTPAFEAVTPKPAAPVPVPDVPPLSIPAPITIEEPDEPDEEDAPEEDDEPEEEEEEDPGAPDPFVSAIRPPIDSVTPEEIAVRRAEAIQTALSGEHKIYFSDAAGPGTLAEALTHLLNEGRVTAEFREAPDEEPHLLYRPQ